MKKFELFYPLDEFVVSQKFGENPEYYKKHYNINFHNGWDMVGHTGQIVRAAHDGIVVYAGEDANEGWGIVIRTNEEREYGGGSAFMKSIYWHLIADSILVRVGQQIKVGEIIAKCDSTGVLLNVGGFNTAGKDAASHLHFGIKPQANTGEPNWIWYNIEQKNGVNGAIDPGLYFNGFYAKDANNVIGNLKTQISILQRIINFFKELLKK